MTDHHGRTQARFTVISPRGWALWRESPVAIAAMLTMDFAAVLAALLTRHEPLTRADWILFPALTVVALLHGVLTSPAEERRRAARLRSGRVEYVDQASIWMFSAALLLPAWPVIVLVVLVRVQGYLIARRPPNKWICSSAIILLSTIGVQQLAQLTPLQTLLADGRFGARVAVGAAWMLACVAVYFVVQAVLFGVVRGLITHTWSIGHLVGSWQDNLFIVYTLVIAVVAALAVSLTPFALLPVAALAVRETWGVQRVAQLESERERLALDALHDPLTGLRNRRGFEAEAQLALVASTSANQVTVVLMLDIDHFKGWNTRLGHVGGDQVLSAFADVLRRHTRTTDLVCRWGGEEFAVLLSTATVTDAVGLAERIRSAVATMTTTVTTPAGGRVIQLGRDGIPHVTVSIGIAATDGAIALLDLQELADRALQHAKDGGRDRVSCWPYPLPLSDQTDARQDH